MRYVSLIVDNNTNATDGLYTYVSESDLIAVGQKVRAPFGVHDRVCDAYVAEVCEQPPAGAEGVRFKKVLEIDPEIWLSEEAVQTALWMHRRCLCRYIEAVRCFLPGSTPAKGRTKNPFDAIEYRPDSPAQLTQPQARALEAISGALEEHRFETFLLFGVTGSGKTEVYLQAMAKCLEDGRQGIVLVPEISLTPQTVSRFTDRFGPGRVAILHSRLTPQQRDVEYRRIARGEADLVIGARSAVFAPLQDIGLIVMDEEHETSYKSDKSPKYDTVEVAARRAQAHGAAFVLGSATPSVADYYRSEPGVFTRLELGERYNRTPLPAVDLVDMRKEVRAGNRSLFSRSLAGGIRDNLARGRQVILFLNRRGYFSFVSCRECGYTVRCPDCGIAMTYHKERDALVCHYCGRREDMPKVCPECGSKVIGRFGAGTEQVEEKARELFPDASIERLDLDAVRAKGSLERVLDRFGRGKIDMLIGTQLVAKGLDFANVGLVGVVSADVTLNIPDFRSAERTFQLVTQAAGRAGRGGEQGSVVIQTYAPEHPALIAAAAQDYRLFYEREIRMREAAGYAPYMDVFQIVLSDETADGAQSAAERFALRLRAQAAKAFLVLGPSQAPLNKAGDLYRWQILIKSPAGRRRELSEILAALKKDWGTRKEKALLQVDINPFSLL